MDVLVRAAEEEEERSRSASDRGGGSPSPRTEAQYQGQQQRKHRAAVEDDGQHQYTEAVDRGSLGHSRSGAEGGGVAAGGGGTSEHYRGGFSDEGAGSDGGSRRQGDRGTAMLGGLPNAGPVGGLPEGGRSYQRRTKWGRFTSEITPMDLEDCFHLPIEEASERLGVGLTVLKNLCRQNGIGRWPYRKVRRGKWLADKLRAGFGTGQDRASFRRLVSELGVSRDSPVWRNLGIDVESVLSGEFAPSAQPLGSRQLPRNYGALGPNDAQGEGGMAAGSVGSMGRGQGSTGMGYASGGAGGGSGGGSGSRHQNLPPMGYGAGGKGVDDEYEPVSQPPPANNNAQQLLKQLLELTQRNSGGVHSAPPVPSGHSGMHDALYQPPYGGSPTRGGSNMHPGTHHGGVHELWNTGGGAAGSGGRGNNNSNDRFTEALAQGLSDSALQKLAAGVGLSPQDQQRLQQLQRLAGMSADEYPGQYRSQQQGFGNSSSSMEHQQARPPQQQQQQQPHAALQEALLAAASGNSNATSTALFALLAAQGNSGSGSLYSDNAPALHRQPQHQQAAPPPSGGSNGGTEFAALLQQLGVNSRGDTSGVSDDLFNLLKSLTQQGGGSQHTGGGGRQPMPNGTSSWGPGGNGPPMQQQQQQPPAGVQRDTNPLSSHELLQQALAQFASNGGLM